MNTLNEIPSRILGNIFPEIRMASALTISILADLLDYTAAPLVGMPIIGDAFDLIVMSLLYSITKSKDSDSCLKRLILDQFRYSEFI